MPFKTKKQKLKAIERRYTISQTLPVDYQKFEVSAKDNAQEKIAGIKAQELQSKAAARPIEQDYNYVKLDLLKIIILAGIISFSQILILVFKNRLPIPFLQGY